MIEKFDFNDMLIKPSKTTKIKSRVSINPFSNGFLPLFTAPMDTVVDANNARLFKRLKINVCLPRGEQDVNAFISHSLSDIEQLYLVSRLDPKGKYLIDIANGHMEGLLTTVKEIKNKFPDIVLMVGNIANPKTYRELSNAGADYVRVGIGNGGACSTTVHTGVGYPMASLIKECYTVSCKLDNPAKIVADGGMQNYSDIIKALALGADYVMLGSIFNKSLESSGPNYIFKFIKIPLSVAKVFYKMKIPVYKKFRGMSTKEVQKKWGRERMVSSEGVTRYRRVEYSLDKWTENFEDYLRSSMSYAGAIKLTDFIGKCKIIKISGNAHKRYNK